MKENYCLFPKGICNQVFHTQARIHYIEVAQGGASSRAIHNSAKTNLKQILKKTQNGKKVIHKLKIHECNDCQWIEHTFINKW